MSYGFDTAIKSVKRWMGWKLESKCTHKVGVIEKISCFKDHRVNEKMTKMYIEEC